MRRGGYRRSNWCGRCSAKLRRTIRTAALSSASNAEGALETARRAEADIFAGRSLGPLHGIPLGAKDNIDIAGVPTTCHSKILLDNIARNDAPAIANLRAAGAIMLGKQSLHEFAFGGPSKE